MSIASVSSRPDGVERKTVGLRFTRAAMLTSSSNAPLCSACAASCTHARHWRRAVLYRYETTPRSTKTYASRNPRTKTSMRVSQLVNLHRYARFHAHWDGSDNRKHTFPIRRTLLLGAA